MLDKVLYIEHNGVRVEIALTALVEHMARKARRNRTQRSRIHFAKAKVVGDPVPTLQQRKNAALAALSGSEWNGVD